MWQNDKLTLVLLNCRDKTGIQKKVGSFLPNASGRSNRCLFGKTIDRICFVYISQRRIRMYSRRQNKTVNVKGTMDAGKDVETLRSEIENEQRMT